MFNRLDRYILRQFWAPFALGLAGFMFMLTMRLLFELGELVIRKGAPIGLVFGLLLVNLPRLLILVIPAGGLLAVLSVMGRMGADSELTALKAAGVPLWRQGRAALLFGMILTGASLLLTHVVAPQSALFSKNLADRLITESDIFRMIQPRVIFDQVPGLTLYVESVDFENRRLNGIFVYEARDDGGSQLSLAKSGAIAIDGRSGRISLSLEAGHTYEFPADNPLSLRETQFAVQQLGGQLPQKGRWALREIDAASVWQLSGAELRSLLKRGSELNPELRRAARFERLGRNTIPLAALILCLIAVPLAVGAARGGRGAALGLAIFVFALYGILQSMLINLGLTGRVSPWLAALLPPFLFGLAGAILLRRRGRYDGSREWQFWWRLRAALTGHWREFLARRRPPPGTESAAGGAGAVENEGAGDDAEMVYARRGGPKIIDRYIAGITLRYIGYALLAIVMMGVINDVRGALDDVARNNIPLHQFALLIALGIPELVQRVLPFAVLIGVLIAFSLLSRHSELTVLRAAGISIWRQGAPVLVCSGVIALAMFIAGEFVVPPAASAHWTLMETVKNRKFMGGRLEDKNWLFGSDPAVIYNYDYLPPTSGADGKAQDDGALAGFSYFKLDFTQGTLSERLSADMITLQNGGFHLRDGMRRRRDGEGWAVSALHDEDVLLPDAPAFFKPTERLDSLAMSTPALYRYAERLRAKRLPGLEGVMVDLHNKFAWPAACLVMALLGLAFAFKSGRSGSLFGIGMGLGLGIFYAVINVFLTQIGETGLEPPLLAAWGANLITLIGSLYLYFGENS